MASKEEEIESLDNQFMNGLKKIENLLDNLNFRQKFIVNQWIKKLKNSDSSIEERKLRNQLILNFLNNRETDALNLEPFSNLPERFNGPLTDFRKLMTTNLGVRENLVEDEKTAYLFELFSMFPDKGVFLAKQPVPHDGFFILTVLKRNRAKNLDQPDY
ncbi:uncharacterized protein LOC142236761 [Haematobia irritans]|uniref:uncharacterized protein LOC142236761 n=1 Tax=Haematobia irritans TaxID=7368 RepID=UPI003F4FD06C